MATPNGDNYGRGSTSTGLWLLFGFLTGLLAIFREKGVQLIKLLFGVEITWIQYFAGAIVILLIVGLLATFFQDTHRETRQQAHETGLEEGIYAQAKMGIVDPPFFLYLRPFVPRGKLAYPDAEEQADLQAITTFATLPLENIEVILGKAIKPGRLLALGRKGEAVGALRFEVEDNQWQEKLKLLAKHAKGILLMPALSEGTLWEVGYLMNHPQLLKKAIFLMPPKPESLRAKLKVKPSLLEEEWALLLNAFRAEGSNFPAYNKNGMLFTLNSQGNVHQKASPNWSRPSEMGRAIIRLLD